MKKLYILVSLSFISLFGNSQNEILHKFSYSFAWSPTYSDLFDMPLSLAYFDLLSFEAGINLRPNEIISLSTGFGFMEYTSKGEGWPLSSSIAPNRSYKYVYNEYRLPISMNFFVRNTNKSETYIKTEFINQFRYFINYRYLNDEFYSSQSSNYYTSTAGVGFGKIYKLEKIYGIQLESILEMWLHNNHIFDYFSLRFNLGIII